MENANSRNAVRFFWAEESGQDLVEYALIAVFIALGGVVTLKSVATNVGTVFAAVASTLTTAL